MKISELIIQLQETVRVYGDMEVRACIYDLYYDEAFEDEITDSAVENYIATERYENNKALVLNNSKE
ncbi:hypothetical protein [Clostridium paraputrificum]|uniref:hypothetical protein n=1 Tax=Clostridium paraputrificum TaxID=29363 RepID=UPI0024810831|nr:hypothetical protein [Clostridium paraputrificum]MDB2086596.1 hypothetical protein [Clostridium paraputrificum]